MNTTDYINIQSTVAGCDKRPANDCIESLGLKNYAGPTTKRPSFRTSVVAGLYNSTQTIVAAKANSLKKWQVKAAINHDPEFLYEEAAQLLDIHGSSVWGTMREHLLDASRVGTTLYPKDLNAENESDQQRIIYLLRCWMASRVYNKAQSNVQATQTSTQKDQHGQSVPTEIPSLIEAWGCSGDSSGPFGIFAWNEYHAATTSNQKQDFNSTTAHIQNDYYLGPIMTQVSQPDDRDTASNSRDLSRTHMVVSPLAGHDRTISTASTRPESEPYRSVKHKIKGTPHKEPIDQQHCFAKRRRGQKNLSVASASTTTSSEGTRIHSLVESEGVVPNSFCPRAHASAQDTYTTNIGTHFQDTDEPPTLLEGLPVLTLERTEVLRRTILSKLLQILRSSQPCVDVIDGLDLMINEVWTARVKAQMEEGGRLPLLKQVLFCWIDMHTHLFAFREATRYNGKSGEAWLAYVHNLPDWHSESLAMEAFNVMGTWKWNMLERGEWFEEEHFNRNLAMFFARLGKSPGHSVEFLMRGMSAYNKELLVWFS